MERIIVKRCDGGVSIIIPIQPLSDKEIEATIKTLQEQMPETTLLSWRRATEDDLPKDRDFRGAWTDNERVTVNIPKAKEIHRHKLRGLRKPLLEQLDMEYQKADELGDTARKKEIARKKQALRDITKLSLPDDLTKLKNFVPVELVE